MSDQISLLRASAHPGDTEGVTATTPTMRYRPEKCEFAIHIGVFFDGTRNNQYWQDPDLEGATQLARKKDSNVARLFRAYPNQPLEGYYPRYVPGVGTPFLPIGEVGASTMGMGFGAGGDARIVFGLLHVLNAMHQSINSGDIPMIDANGVTALCRNSWLPMQASAGERSSRMSLADQRALEKVGMGEKGGAANWQRFLVPYRIPQGAVRATRAEDQRHTASEARGGLH